MSARFVPAVISVVDSLYTIRYADLDCAARILPGTREILIDQGCSPEDDEQNLMEGVLLALEQEGYLEAIKPKFRRAIAQALVRAGYGLGHGPKAP